jgi:septum formation protein
MTQSFILASGSAIRAQLLRQAGVAFQVETPRVDEETVKAALLAEDARPRNIADALAELKAAKVSSRRPAALVMGCDQVLDLGGALLSKAESPEQALEQLTAMRGKVHHLLSAAVICEDGRPVWRHVGHVRLTMRQASDTYLQSYVDRNWESIRHAVGAYKLEEEGARLFARIDGDYFNVLGLPLLEVLGYLGVRGVIDQ